MAMVQLKQFRTEHHKLYDTDAPYHILNTRTRSHNKYSKERYKLKK